MVSYGIATVYVIADAAHKTKITYDVSAIIFWVILKKSFARWLQRRQRCNLRDGDVTDVLEAQETSRLL